MRKLLSTDTYAAIRRDFSVDGDGRAVVETKQDVTDIVEGAKFEHNLHDERTPWKGDGMVKAATIPLSIWFDLHRKGIVQNAKKFKQWLNDRDNAVFRTRPGRV